MVFHRISLKTYSAGYGRFRPNKHGHHLSCGYYRGGWHPSYPALILSPIFREQKFLHSRNTPASLVSRERIAKVSRLLRPVGPGFMSQNPSPGYYFHSPQPLSVCWFYKNRKLRKTPNFITPTTA